MNQPDLDSLFTKNPSFCALPWLHIYASIDGILCRCCLDSTQYYDHYMTTVKPVMELQPDALGCISTSPYAEDNASRVESLESAFNSPAMRETRLKMLAGKKLGACKACYSQEAMKGHSMREHFNKHYRHSENWPKLLEKTSAEGHLDSRPTYLDLRLGNTCNLQCQMCSFPVSSSWRKKVDSWHQASIDPFTDNSGFWEDIKSLAPTLRLVHFAGGEPFLQRSHLRLLRLLVELGEAKHVEVVYVSNLTILPKDVFELWTHFEKVKVIASCDGYGPLFESIRCGGKWDVFSANVLTVKARVPLRMSATIQKDNLPFLEELWAWAHSVQVPIDLFNILEWPKSMAIQQLGRAELARCHGNYLQSALHYRTLGNEDLAHQIEGLCRILQAILTDGSDLDFEPVNFNQESKPIAQGA